MKNFTALFMAMFFLAFNTLNGQISEDEGIGTEIIPDKMEVDSGLVKLFEGTGVVIPATIVKPPPTLACIGEWKKLSKNNETCFPGALNGTEAKKKMAKLIKLREGTKAFEDYVKTLFNCDKCPPFEKGCVKEVKDIKSTITGTVKRNGVHCVKWKVTFKARCTSCVPDINVDLLKRKNGSIVSRGLAPNPASDFVKINMQFKKEYDHMVIRITDLAGRNFFVESYAITGLVSFDKTLEINMLSPGVYLVTTLFDDGHIDTQKLVVK